MRDCQICNHNGKRVILNDYDGQDMCLFECTACGHRYVDALNLSQAWFDDFYLTRYTTNDKDRSDARLASLADFVAVHQPKHALDIGGMDGELQNYLSLRSVKCDVAGVGSKETKKYEAVILSHTLEHIYDIRGIFERVHGALKSGGRLFVEIPIHLYDNYQDPKAYDYHWQHINKLRPRDIEALFTKHGLTIELSEQIADYWEYQVWRIAGRNG